MCLIVIGSGLAGYLLVKELREQGYLDSIKVFTKDDGAFYSKPQISNALSLSKSPDDLVNILPKKMAERYNFQLFSSAKVENINTQEKYVLVGNERHEFTQLVMATGANTVTADWDEYACKINCLDDYRKFRNLLTKDKSVGIIGSGLVGCEIAADLIGSGYKVGLISNTKSPISRLMPEQCGYFLLKKLQESGICWNYYNSINIEQNDRYIINQRHEFDLVISALGIKPNVDLALKSGLSVGNGILVDGYCETSVKDIFALGDCANVNGLNLAYVAPIRQCVNVLSKKLMGLPVASVNYPLMPVILKTPMCKAFILNNHVPKSSWDVVMESDGVIARNIDASGHVCGFVLLGESTKHRAGLMQECKSFA